MKYIWSIYKKELRSYFNSPVAYIVSTVFLLLSGWMFFQQFFLMGQASMRSLFGIMPMLFIFFSPAITMRLLAEEKKTGTIELLMSLPVRNIDILMGKYLAALSLLVITVLLTIPYGLVISFIGPLDWGPVIGGYIGIVFLGAGYLALGMLTSTATSNQIVAFILGLALCFLFFIMDKILPFMPDFSVSFFQYLSLDYHFNNIARGVIDTRDVIFYLSFIAGTMTLSSFAMESETWR